ncbi:MAG TPA: segregation/condensation protein A, partial [Armatimonadota bacterium]|nr:segregation/condensation protein A [Armatimonadota bacterium]
MKLKTVKNNPYQIVLPMFEGPLDLLLHLIRENKIDIYDIPIAEVTDQYLQYLT